jgi:hypothetical protein
MKKERDSVELIASGYEFVCPYCNELNNIIEIPRSNIVYCRCGKEFDIDLPEHAYQ